MEDFIRAQVLELSRTPNVRLPRPADCMIVSRLAPRSLAAHAGVGVKDLLVSLDGTPAGSLAPRTWTQRARERRWVFYSRPRHELVDLRCSGIEPGVELQHTTDGIKQRYQPARSSPSDLEALWEGRDWAALESLSAATLSALGRDRDTPALLFLGAALVETGRAAEGTRLVEEYMTAFSRNWTLNFTGIGAHYLALERIRRGERQAGVELLQASFETHRCARLADAVLKHTGTRPPLEAPRWLGRPFPAAYCLPRVEARDMEVSLAKALAALGDGQLLGVCHLASYRGNGPYDDLMWRYHNFATWFARFLPAFHVTTMQPDRYPDRPHYFQGEDQVRADGLPLELLLEDGQLTRVVDPPGSPFVLLLDRGGTVRCEGELGCVDLWNALAAL